MLDHDEVVVGAAGIGMGGPTGGPPSLPQGRGVGLPGGAELGEEIPVGVPFRVVVNAGHGAALPAIGRSARHAHESRWSGTGDP